MRQLYCEFAFLAFMTGWSSVAFVHCLNSNAPMELLFMSAFVAVVSTSFLVMCVQVIRSAWADDRYEKQVERLNKPRQGSDQL